MPSCVVGLRWGTLFFEGIICLGAPPAAGLQPRRLRSLPAFVPLPPTQHRPAFTFICPWPNACCSLLSCLLHTARRLPAGLAALGGRLPQDVQQDASHVYRQFMGLSFTEDELSGG